MEKVFLFLCLSKNHCTISAIVSLFEPPFEKWIVSLCFWGFNSFLSSLFPLWFIVWKSTRRFYPSVYAQVCIWKSCSEEGKRANKQSCWEWGSGTQQLWVKVLRWGLGSIFLWLCFLWDWWGGWCFWENGAVRGERLCVQVDRVSTQGMSWGGGRS